MTTKYKVSGMSCAACSSRVERTVSALDGVDSCSVNLLTGDMSVVGDVSSRQVKDAVKKAGYGIEELSVSRKTVENAEKVSGKTEKRLLIRLLISPVLKLTQSK